MSETISIILGVGGLAVAILSVGIAFAVFRGDKHKDAVKENMGKSNMQADVRFIKEQVKDTALDIRELRNVNREICDRITRVEESSKSAHHRIDELVAEK